MTQREIDICQYVGQRSGAVGEGDVLAEMWIRRGHPGGEVVQSVNRLVSRRILVRQWYRGNRDERRSMLAIAPDALKQVGAAPPSAAPSRPDIMPT